MLTKTNSSTNKQQHKRKDRVSAKTNSSTNKQQHKRKDRVSTKKTAV
jgi:hypothetical protein